MIAQVVALLEKLFAITATEGLLSKVHSFMTCESHRVKAGVRAETAPVSGQSSRYPRPSKGRHVRNDLRRGVALAILIARCFLFDDRVRSGPIWRRFCGSRSDDRGGTAVCPTTAVHLRLPPLEPRHLAGNASRAMAVRALPLAFESF
uniref:Putative secreted protein n=1 Tax=Ixodes ricinus TaxID=34613 RepID=A0A6B0UVI5_IXORI